MSVYKDIHRCKRFGKEKSATARELGLARGTVRKFWNMDEREYDAYQRRALTRRHKFEGYRDEIITVVELNAADGEMVHGSSIYDQRPAEQPDTRKADEKGLISYLGNRYSVPAAYAECTVAVRADRLHLRIHDMDTGEELTVHRLPRGYGADEAYAELAAGSEDVAWKGYLEENRARYRRYWREQAGRLRRFLDTDPDPRILAEAISFCREAGSVGAGDLNTPTSTAA